MLPISGKVFPIKQLKANLKTQFHPICSIDKMRKFFKILKFHRHFTKLFELDNNGTRTQNNNIMVNLNAIFLKFSSRFSLNWISYLKWHLTYRKKKDPDN